MGGRREKGREGFRFAHSQEYLEVSPQGSSLSLSPPRFRASLRQVLKYLSAVVLGIFRIRDAVTIRAARVDVCAQIPPVSPSASRVVRTCPARAQGSQSKVIDFMKDARQSGPNFLPLLSDGTDGRHARARGWGGRSRI